ncbi:MAG TPA: tetratricopeptide repeat protein [Rhodocyclaceae bacterium]|nr:tetratricopeptide repeat protein [Rhodocyclaceae bacterium]
MSRFPEAQRTVQEAFQQGLAYHRGGNLEEAETTYRAILKLIPEHGPANFNLGLLAVQLGQPQAGLKHFRIALEHDQTEKHWLGYLGALYLAGQEQAFADLLALARKNSLSPAVADALGAWLGKVAGTIAELPPSINSALSLDRGHPPPAAPKSADDGADALIQSFSAGRYSETEVLARQLTIVYPERGFFWKVLGAALWMQGQTEAALEPMVKAVDLMPDDREALCNLGAALDELGHPEEAEAMYRRVLSMDPHHADALNNLGDNLRLRHRFDEAMPLLLHALDVRPDFPEAHNNLGCTLHTTGDLPAARRHLERALLLRPNYPEALINLGNVLQEERHFLAAEQVLRQAAAISPPHPVALNNLGNLLAILGREDEAENLFNQALAARPDYYDAFSNLLFNLNYSERGSPEYRLARAQDFGERVTRSASGRYETWNQPLRPDRLRIGLVSGDLRNHPVGFFLAGSLENLAASSLELIAYPTQDKEDNLTSRIRSCCHGWRPLAGLDDRTAAGRIHGDGIHVLLDLSGHTAHNRLPVFAWRPAPVQATWLGYFATTGVPQIDYLLADSVSVPPEHQGYFTEAIQYLPDTRLCFTAPDTPVTIAELPALRTGYLTFGSFQNLAKANGKVLDTWSRILSAFKGSRLRWQCKQFSDPAVAVATLERLERHGIARQRVSLHGAMPRDIYLAAHNEVDFILDTFPYPGGTTTCEALWMGVPTLTLASGSMHSRQGASLMTAARLSEWVVASEDEYVETARRLGSDIRHLADLRATLRPRVAASPLFDAARFARHLETALWEMWRRYSSGVQF